MARSKQPKQLDLIQHIQSKARIDELGREIGDPTPLAIPIKHRREETQDERIKRLVRSERLAQEAANAGFETFEEADDFDVGDDFDPTSPYEEVFDPRPTPPSPAPSNPAGPTTVKPGSAVVPPADGPVTPPQPAVKPLGDR